MTMTDVNDLRELAARAREKQQRVAISPDAAERIADDLESHLATDTSDGHHTFEELYDYRMLYNAHAAAGWLAAGIPVVKSWHHSDGELCFGGGWFIVTATLPTGQVSNHYRSQHWDLFAVPAVDLPPEYDGHTPAEAAERLRHAARDLELCCTEHGTHVTPHRGCILR